MKHFLFCAILLLTVVRTAGQQRQGDGLDNLLQHVPMAAVLTMKACGLQPAVSASWSQLSLSAVASYGVSAAVSWSLKTAVSERRPDKSDCRSFPSGHATFAFAGATVLCHEYGRLSPWVSIGGYGLATLTALDRVRRDRHYLHDVCAGAAIGWGATELTYLLRRKLFAGQNVDLGFSGQTFDLTFRW